MSYQEHLNSLTVPYREPSPGKTWTTHDAVSASHTVEAPRNKRGDTQIHGGIEYVFDGEKWLPVEPKA
ncbi:MAG TPA: hypothetical protein VJW20_07310 [Candidatus Angelobacter sp.]|nr:hypothetical protein [Candidatus Angelobacter sp.]